MILTKTFEKFHNGHNQVLEITAKANSRAQAELLGYDDFSINLYIDNKFIADISPVLAKTDVYCNLIDSINWVEMYAEQMQPA